MELQHVENVARYLRQVGYKADLETGWRLARGLDAVVFRTKPEPQTIRGFRMNAIVEIFIPQGEAQRIQIRVEHRDLADNSHQGTYHTVVDANTIYAHGEREAIPGLLEELATEAARSAWDAHQGEGEMPDSSIAWEFFTNLLAETEDDRLDLIAGGEPVTFEALYEAALGEIQEQEQEQAARTNRLRIEAALANEHRANLQGAKIVFPDGTTFDIVQPGWIKCTGTTPAETGGLDDAI